VTGKIDFGNDRNVSIGSIVYDFLNLILCVKSRMFFAVVFPGIFADDGLLANRANLREFGIFFLFRFANPDRRSDASEPVDVMTRQGYRYRF